MKTTLPTLSEVVDITANMAYDGNFITNHIWDYNDFLKQPLKLEMFIPCKDGVPINEPKKIMDFIQLGNKDSMITSDEFQDITEYQQALNRVIFKGFRISINNEDLILLTNEDMNDVKFPTNNGIYWNKLCVSTISDLCNKVELTDKKFNELKNHIVNVNKKV